MNAVKTKKPFQYKTLPWILLAILAAANIAIILLKGANVPDEIPMGRTFLMYFAGVVGGLVAGYITARTVRGNRDFLQMKQGMIFSAVVCTIGILLSVETNWMLILCVVLSGLTLGFFLLYLPRYTKIYEDISKRNG